MFWKIWSKINKENGKTWTTFDSNNVLSILMSKTYFCSCPVYTIGMLCVGPFLYTFANQMFSETWFSAEKNFGNLWFSALVFSILRKATTTRYLIRATNFLSASVVWRLSVAFPAWFQCVSVAFSRLAWCCQSLALSWSARCDFSDTPATLANRDQLCFLSVFLFERADVTEFRCAHLLSAECRSLLHARLRFSSSVCLKAAESRSRSRSALQIT